MTTAELARELLMRMADWQEGEAVKTDDDLRFEARLWAIAGEPDMARIVREAITEGGD